MMIAPWIVCLVCNVVESAMWCNFCHHFRFAVHKRYFLIYFFFDFRFRFSANSVTIDERRVAIYGVGGFKRGQDFFFSTFMQLQLYGENGHSGYKKCKILKALRQTGVLRSNTCLVFFSFTFSIYSLNSCIFGASHCKAPFWVLD